MLKFRTVYFFHRTAIAHSIREQIDVVTKSLCLLGHVPGVLIPDDDLRREFLPPLYESLRTEVSDFTPILNQLTPDEVERNDKEREREVRRKRRQTKGRGVTLPDREHVKTHRTLVPKPCNEALVPVQDSRGEIVYPLPGMAEPYPIHAPVLPDKPVLIESGMMASKVTGGKMQGMALLPSVDLLSRTAGTRLKKLKQEASSLSSSSSSGGVGGGGVGGESVVVESSTVGGGSGSRTASETEDKREIKGSPMRVRKVPVLKPTLEELGLHEHIIDGVWHCACW